MMQTFNLSEKKALGWAFGPAGSAAIVKERLVRPDGFRITTKAEDYHKISHARAEKEGLALVDVLTEFMKDLLYVVNEKHGRFVCHHVEFDAGILTRELERYNLREASLQFSPIARKALCTMCPQIGRWLRESWGEDSGVAETMPTQSLKKLVEKLLPECKDLLPDHHSAGVDALLHRRLAYAMYGLGCAPCRLTKHTHQKRSICAEGGGNVEECVLCEERF